MKRVKKIANILGICVCTVLILLAAAALITPLLIDKTALGDKVSSEISSLIGGDLEFDSVALSVFPSPRVVLINPQIHILKQLSASAAAIDVFPEITAFLTGHFVFKKAAVREPNVTIWLPESTDSRQKRSSPFEINQLVPTLLKTFSRLSKVFLPVNNGTISQGSVKLVYDKTTTFTLDSFDAVMKKVSDTITFQVTAASNIFDNISLTGTVHTRQPGASAHVKLGKLKLGAIYRGLLPDASLRIEKGEADIDLDITFNNQKQIEVNYNCSAPDVRLVHTRQAVNIEVRTLSGRVDVNSDSAAIAVSELILANPLMRLSGSVKISDEKPKLGLEFKGQGIDINSTRSVSLALSGSNSVTQTIFKILQSGTIPLLAISGQAGTLNGLADLDNLVLEASLTNGNIFIPGANLELTGVSGGVGIKKGVLAGKHVSAQWHNSTVEDGEFEIDLTKDPLPLHVKTAILVDVADVPAILPNFIENQSFNDELKQIKDLKGHAIVALLLTGDTDKLNVNVSATDINLTARYHKLPYPLEITDGGLSYGSDRIKWEQLKGSLRESSFAAFSGDLDLGETKNITITSGTSRIVIPDLLPWLSSNNTTRQIAGYYGGGKGILQLSDIQASGPLKDLGKAHYSLVGELVDLAIQHMSKQPGPLRVASLKFKAEPKGVEFSDGQLSMLDSSLTVSDGYFNYMADKKKHISLSFAGQAGPQLVGWLSENAHIPPWMKIKPFLIRPSHLTYSNHGKHKISAALALQGDLEVNTDVSLAANSLVIDTLMVKDHRSQATLTAEKVNQLIDVSFDGTLHEATVDQIVQITPKISGSIDGKVKISLNLDNPFELSLLGEINGEKLTIPIVPNAPLTIKSIKITGEPDNITFKSAKMSWSDTILSLIGSYIPNSDGLPKIDLDVESESVDADAIMKKIGKKSESPDKEETSQAFFMPMKGLIRFKTNKLKVYNYTFEPLQADVRYQDKKIEITLKEIDLCGITMPGTVSISPPDYSFHLEPKAHDQKLNAILNCFVDQHFKADGTLNLTGLLEGNGAAKDLIRSTTGHLDISIANGHVYHDLILLNVFKFLNSTQVLTEKVSAHNMLEKGVGFDLLKTHMELSEGKLVYKSFTVDADEIKISGTGEIDYNTKEIDFTILAAPQVMVNTVLGHVPLIGSILQTMATIPISLSGNINDVHVLPLAPSAVNLKLREIMRQVCNRPLNIVHLDDYHAKFK